MSLPTKPSTDFCLGSDASRRSVDFFSVFFPAYYHTHKLSFLDEANMKFFCVYCEECFSSSKALDRHTLSEAHGSRYLPNRFDMYNNRNLVVQSGCRLHPGMSRIQIQQYCTSCEKNFRSKRRLNRHLRNSNALTPENVSTLESTKAAVLSPSTIFSQHRRYDGGTSTMSEEVRSGVTELSSYCHSSEDLLNNHYILTPFSDEDITGLAKCKNCGRQSSWPDPNGSL